MKIYLLIQPHDYYSAEVEVFKNEKDAKETLKQSKKDKLKNSENWFIREENI